MKEFDNPNFSVEKCVLNNRVISNKLMKMLFLLLDTKLLVKECVGGPDLLKRKKEIQAYSEQTSATLKKSVYANYMEFIETAKEISSKIEICSYWY